MNLKANIKKRKFDNYFDFLQKEKQISSLNA